MLLQDIPSDLLGGVEHRLMQDCPLERRGQRGDGSNLVRPLSGHRTGDHSTQAVPDQVNLATRLFPCLINGLEQAVLDQQVRTIGIHANPGEVRAVTDTPQPGIEVRHINIGTEETGDDNDGGTFAVRHSQAIVNRGGVQEQEFGPEQRLVPNGKVRVRLMFADTT
jgi:hypothetical protein